MHLPARFSAHVRPALGWTVLAMAMASGCRHYDVDNRPSLRDEAPEDAVDPSQHLRRGLPKDPSDASARMRMSPGQRSGLTSTAQEIEHNLGY